MNNNFDDIPTPIKSHEENKTISNEFMNKENNTDDILLDNKKVIKNESKSMINFFKDIFKYVTTHKINELAELLIYVLIIIGFCIILSIPFGFLKSIFFDALILFGINFNVNIQNIFSTIWDVFYLIIAIGLFLVLTRERFYASIRNKQEIEELKKEINK